jgi:CSLREA domain-containing protein
MPRGGRAAGKHGWIAGAVVLAALLVPATAPAATIKVKSNADEFDVAGNCTLREAIQTANANADQGGCHRRHAGAGAADSVVLEGQTEYPIVISGGNEDGNAQGDFDIASRIRIKVSGQGRAAIDANEMDRAIDVQPSGDLRASKLQIANGSPPTNGFSQGGAGILNRGRLDLSRSELTLNDAVVGQAVNGGAIEAIGAKTILDRVDINHNTAANSGGGISYVTGQLRVTNSVIDANSGHGGGGLSVGGSDENARVLLKGTTITGNTDFSDFQNAGGGGIFVSFFGEGTLKATNITVSGNTAFAAGGGIHAYSGTLDVNAATITGNTADFNGDSDGHGGGISGSGVQVRNSIIAGNEDAAAVNPAQQCAIATAGPAHNVVEIGGGCAETGSNLAVVNPLLGPLAENGGPTPTYKLLTGSPAIGHAGKDAPKNDQRGIKRDSNPDSGAFERR